MGQHVVRRGESLAAIAQHAGTNWRELARLNGLHNPNRLYIGQRLIVPNKGVNAAAPVRSASTSAKPAAISAGKPPVETPNADAPLAVAGGVTDAQLRAIMPRAGADGAVFGSVERSDAHLWHRHKRAPRRVPRAN